jgi:hypothetical protein
MSTATKDVLVALRSQRAYLNRDPQKWWDDEHVLDNGHTVVLLDRAATEIEALRSVVRHMVDPYWPPNEQHHWRETNEPITEAEADAVRRALDP